MRSSGRPKASTAGTRRREVKPDCGRSRHVGTPVRPERPLHPPVRPPRERAFATWSSAGLAAVPRGSLPAARRRRSRAVSRHTAESSPPLTTTARRVRPCRPAPSASARAAPTQLDGGGDVGDVGENAFRGGFTALAPVLWAPRGRWRQSIAREFNRLGHPDRHRSVCKVTNRSASTSIVGDGDGRKDIASSVSGRRL